MLNFVAVIISYMMLLCTYFVFIDTSLSKHVDMFFDFGFSLVDERGLSLGELIRPFCIMYTYCYLYIFIYNNAFLSICNAFSLIICKVCTKGENSGICKSGPKKATSGYLFRTTPNELKLRGIFME